MYPQICIHYFNYLKYAIYEYIICVFQVDKNTYLQICIHINRYDSDMIHICIHICRYDSYIVYIKIYEYISRDISVHTYSYIFICYIFICTYRYVRPCVYVHIYSYIHTDMYTPRYIFIYIHRYTQICTLLCICSYMFIYTYKYVHP